MAGFVDKVTLTVRAGKGGAGAVSFRREKYVPRGGPDGGDGGRGGDVVFEVRQNLKTLAHLQGRGGLHAENGASGAGRRKHGRDGEELVVVVPPGTALSDRPTGQPLVDLTEAGRRWVYLRGGRGGRGNWHFRSATRQAPRFAQPGEEGEEGELIAELRTIADVGLVGLPNAGKSSLLAALTAATPRVAAYPFTTTVPQLGVMRFGDLRDGGDVLIADIPGLLEGANQGVGLGTRFLEHISRTRALAFLIDLSDLGVGTVEMLSAELAAFDPELARRRRVVVGTKQDLDVDGEGERELRSRYRDDQVCVVSSATGFGLGEIRQVLSRLAQADTAPDPSRVGGG